MKTAITALIALLSTPLLLAQHWTPQFGLTGSPTSGAWCGARQRPVVVAPSLDGVGELLEWNGARWQRRGGAAAMPVRSARLLADPASGDVFAFGYPLAPPITNAHRFDGVRWQPVPGVTNLPPDNCASTWDTVRSEGLFFGGDRFPGVSDDLLVWNGTGFSVVPQSGAWPPARSSASFAFDPVRGRAVLFGGYDSNFLPLSDTWEWDGAQWTAFTGPGPGARFLASMASDPTAAGVVLFGGADANSLIVDQTWLWTGAQWIQLLAPVRPSPRGGAVAVTSPAGLILVGGYGDREYADTWLLANGAWVRLQPDVNPPGRIQAALEYDPVRGELLLCGGISDYFGGFVRDDTWTWNGAWTRRQPATAPPWRIASDLAFDRARGEMLLFGGNSFSVVRGDTWVWNGTDWAQRVPANSPPARWHHRLAFDRLRQRVVLFGGVDANAQPLGDTWLWNGTDWSMPPLPVIPPARAEHVMAFDVLRGVTVLAGGKAFGTPRLDTWLWNGTTWSGTAATTAPTNAFDCAYDDGRARIVAVAADRDYAWNGSDWIVTASATPRDANTTSGAVAAYDEGRARLMSFGGNDLRGTDWLCAYTPTPAATSSFGNGCAPVGSRLPELFAVGRPALRESDFAFGLRVDAANLPALLAFGWTSGQIPLGGGCDLLLNPVAASRFLVSGPNGLADVGLAVPDVTAFRGLTILAQAFAIQNGALAGSAGMRVVIGD